LDSSVLKVTEAEEMQRFKRYGVTEDSLRHLTPFGDRTFTFSVVRDPMSHFISGYTEIQHRAEKCWRDGTGKKSGYKSHDPLYNFLRFKKGTTERALAFINDMAFARLMHSWPNNFHQVQDAHVYPQVAFLVPGRNNTPLHKVVNISILEPFLASLGLAMVNVSELPPEERHTETSSHADNPDRAAMQTLLQTTPHVLCSVVQMLLPDYICLPFEIPKQCVEMLEDSDFFHHLTCPFTIANEFVGFHT